VKMIRRTLAVVLCCLTWPVLAQEAPLSARVAAVRFALDNGWKIPDENLVVAVESQFNNVVDGAIVNSAEVDRLRDASAIARLIGPAVTTGAAAQMLTCRQHKCVPAAGRGVAVISEPEATGKGIAVIGIQVYLPSSDPKFDGLLLTGVIELEQRGAGWVGARNRAGPTLLGVRWPSK
jgi:hypothetical protein